MDVNRRYPSFGQCPRPRLGEVAAPELAPFDTDKDKAVRPIASEGVQVAPQLGDDQFGEHDRADARSGLGRAFDELAEFVDRLGHPDTLVVQIKTAPLRGAASGAPRAGLCLGRPAQRARAVPPLAAFPKGQTHQGGAAVFLGVHCPARGRRVEGGPAGRRTAIGYADPGPGGHSPGFGAYEEGRDKAVDRDNQPTIS